MVDSSFYAECIECSSACKDFVEVFCCSTVCLCSLVAACVTVGVTSRHTKKVVKNLLTGRKTSLVQ